MSDEFGKERENVAAVEPYLERNKEVGNYVETEFKEKNT